MRTVSGPRSLPESPQLNSEKRVAGGGKENIWEGEEGGKFQGPVPDHPRKRAAQLPAIKPWEPT